MNRIVFAAVVVMVVALVSCGGGGGGGAPGLPGAPDSVKALPNFAGTVVANEVDALSLFDAAWGGIQGTLSSAYSSAWNDAFKSKIFPEGLSAYKKTKGTEKSLKVEVSFNDATRLAELLKVAATIEGSTSESWSSNRPLASTDKGFSTSWVYVPPTKGDSYETSASSNATYTFKTAPATIVQGGRTYQVTGVVEIESSGSNSKTWEAYYATNNAFYDKFEEEGESSGSTSIVLSVADVTPGNTGTSGKGAKFFWSYSSENSSVSRVTESTFGSSYGDLEVYNNDGELIATIQRYNGPSYDNNWWDD